MILVFTILLVTIPLIATYLLKNLLFTKLKIAPRNKKFALALTYLLTMVLFICYSLYFSFGPLFYGHRQAAQFYKTNKTELNSLISEFKSLQNKGLLGIDKSSDDNLKVTIQLIAKKQVIEILVKEINDIYELSPASKDQPALIYSPNEPTSVKEILKENQMDKVQFYSILDHFKHIGAIKIHAWPNEYLIGIRETFPFQIAFLFFCKADSKDCNNDKGNAQIDNGVYFDKMSNP